MVLNQLCVFNEFLGSFGKFLWFFADEREGPKGPIVSVLEEVFVGTKRVGFGGAALGGDAMRDAIEFLFAPAGGGAGRVFVAATRRRR